MNGMPDLVDLLDKGIVVLDTGLKIRGWNKWMEVCSGVTKGEALEHDFCTLFPETDRQALLRKVKTTLALGSTTYCSPKNGRSMINLSTHSVYSGQYDLMQLQVMIQPMGSEQVILMISDQTPLIEANNALGRLNERLVEEQEIVDRNVLMLTTRPDGTITGVSSAFCDASGYREEELLGAKPSLFRHKNVAPELYQALWGTLTRGEVWRGEFHNRHKDGSDWWVESVISPIANSEGAVVEYKAILHDVTDKKRAEWLSVTDALTQVYNRAKFDTVLSAGIHEAARYDRPISLILFDIDFFKRINDTFGHQAGDSVLVGVAQIANEVLRGSDLLARWGGEEFAVLLPFTHLPGAVSVAEKIREAIESHGFEKVGQVTASFGVGEYRAGDSVDTLMLRADKALYRAKHDGRNRVFSEE